MKILIITEDNSTGGIYRLVESHVEYFLGQGHTVHWIRPWQGSPKLKVKRQPRLHSYYLPVVKPNLLAQFRTLAKCLPALVANIIYRGGIDITMTHYPLSLWLIYKQLKQSGIPIVANYHGAEYLEIKKYKEDAPLVSLREVKSRLLKLVLPVVLKRLEQASYPQADKIIVLSRYSEKLLTSYAKIEKNKIILIPGFFDPLVFRILPVTKGHLRRQFGLPPNRFIILHASRLEPRKGLKIFLETAAQLQSEPEFFFVVTYPVDANQELYLPRAREFITKNQLTNIQLIPNNLPQYIKLLNAADLFFMSSLELETFGLVTVEALACNLPVIGFPVCATPEILAQLDKRLMIPSVSVTQAAKKIRQWRKLLAGKKFCCRKTIKSLYGRDRIMDDLEELLVSLIDQSARQSSRAVARQ